MRMVFDSYAWVEYFLGTRKGRMVEKHLSEDEILTPAIVLVELIIKAARESWDFQKHLDFIKAKSLIINMSEETITRCGPLHVRMRKKQRHFSLVDSIVLTTALIENAKILTGDRHFIGTENVIFL
jgi:predicted nucleic acid-binding protein